LQEYNFSESCCFTTAFFIDTTQEYLVDAGIFSKGLVKTYPQVKIKIRGTSFEQVDGHFFSHDTMLNPPQAD